MIKIAIVEDNDIDAENLLNTIRKYFLAKKEEYNVKQFHHSENVVEYSHAFDILFFDIELGGMNGMDAARKIRACDEKAIIIFVTNMRQYVIGGYEVGALNYLLKPVQYAGFSLTMDRALTIVRRNENAFLCVRKNDSVYQIKCEDILFIDIVRHDIVIHCRDDGYFLYGSLNKYEESLKKQGFARCSSSALINLRHVRMVKDNEVYVADKTIRISRRMKTSFLTALTVYLGETL